MGLRTRPTPRYEEAFEIDERLLHEALSEEVSYGNPRAVEFDVNSIRSVYALRRGSNPRTIEHCNAVLVTSNSALARVAFEFGRRHESTQEVCSVITDFSLANIAWLKAPMAAPDLPRLELMALCQAAMEPREDLWKRYIEEIDKLQTLKSISARDHEILRFSLKAREELMNLTLGSEEAFSQKTIEQVLESAKRDITREIEERSDKLVADERTKRVEAEGRESSARDRARRQMGKVYFLAERISTATGAVVFWGGVLLVLSSSVPSGRLLEHLLLGASSSPLFRVMSSFMSLVLTVVVIMSSVHLVFGISLADIRGKVRLGLRKAIFARLRKWLMEEDEIESLS